MTTEEKLIVWFGQNWVSEILKSTMPSKDTVQEQEPMREQDRTN